MKLEEYRNVYDKITLSPEASARVLNRIQASRRKRRKTVTKVVGIAAAAAILVMGLFQIPFVSAAAKDAIQRFSILIHLSEGDVRYEEDYVVIRAEAATRGCRMDSLREAEQKLDLPLLKSPDAYEVEDCITYRPYLSESGDLNGILLQDSFYAVGDLQDVKPAILEDMETNPSISYRSGTRYHSPISMQIRIRTDQDAGVDYDNHELEYAGAQEDWSEAAQRRDVSLYTLEHLGVKAVLATVDTDGPSAWQEQAGREPASVTTALFVYRGVEYRYLGAVSQEVMRDFLDGLAE